MMYKSIKTWFAIAAMLACSVAFAQSEPTLAQIYETARAGKLEQAQVMMQQVLVAHPDSAKAHFVSAELSASQGKLGKAREDLATAEKLAPGLPFAKPETVSALRTQLAAKPATANSVVAKKAPDAGLSAPARPASSFPWGMALALGGAAVALVVFLSRKKAQAPMQPQAYPQNGDARGNGLSGTQTFGTGAGAGPAYGQPAYGQPPYGQPAGSGMGGRMMGGLATGLAVGAGVVAAEAIGKNLMGGRDAHSENSSAAAANNDFQPVPNPNNNLGGENFGVADGGSWDDGGSDLASGGDIGGGWDDNS